MWCEDGLDDTRSLAVTGRPRHAAGVGRLSPRETSLSPPSIVAESRAGMQAAYERAYERPSEGRDLDMGRGGRETAVSKRVI